jgi:hypothetical protein
MVLAQPLLPGWIERQVVLVLEHKLRLCGGSRAAVEVGQIEQPALGCYDGRVRTCGSTGARCSIPPHLVHGLEGSLVLGCEFDERAGPFNPAFRRWRTGG